MKNYAMETVERLKDSTKGKIQFNPSFCNIHVNSDGYAEVALDMYEQYRVLAMEVSKEHGIFPEKTSKWRKDDWGPIPSYGESITDDDTLFDWLYKYEDDLGKMQEDYPNITLGDIGILFTWNTMCQQRAFFPGATTFESKQIYR